MARFVIDESLPQTLTTELAALGHESVHTSQIGLTGSSDDRIYQEATARSAILLTADLGFGDARRYPPDHGIVIVRLRKNVPGNVLRSRVIALLLDAEDDLRDMARTVLLLEPGRRRTRKL